MRVLMISLFSHMPHHVATEVEILQRHLDDKDEVTVLGCNGFLPACLHKIDNSAMSCRECVTSRANGMRMLDSAPTTFALDDFYNDEDKAKEDSLQTEFDSLDAIREYEVDGFDIGYAALSSTVFLHRDAYMQTAESRQLFARMILAAYRTFCAVREFVRQHDDFDRVYIFNGRFATCRGAYRACQQANMHIFLHERGSDNSKYMLYEHELPHDIPTVRERIRSRWEQADEAERKTGETFFEQRRARVEKFWHSHTKAQQVGRLPASWDESRRNIVVYTSSDDEYVAIGPEWITPGFKSQSDAIVNLSSGLRDSGEDVMLYVRVHPFLKNIDNKDTRLLYSLSGEGVEIIPPESEICSYTMLDACDKCVTFGSTIGIEAVYWGKPSILAGMSFFRELGGNYVAKSDAELLQLALSDLEPKPREPAIIYGVHIMNFGIPFKYYEAANFETGKYRGKQLRTAMAYSPFADLLPAITRKFGSRPAIRNRVERVAHAVCYLPFLFVYDLIEPIRAAIRKRSSTS